MRFERDTQKAVRNVDKHGVSFEEAVTVLGDPLSDTFDDPDHSEEERRFLIVVASDRGRVLIVAHTDDGAVVRIISAREPTPGERKWYEESRG